MTRYKGGYRSGTIRHDKWDYRRAAWYFVTICTEDRRPFFGRVRNGIIGLSGAGGVAAREWQRTPAVRSYVRLDAWVVMPDHVHGLIGITTESPAYSDGDMSKQHAVDSSRRDESTASGDAEFQNEFRLHAHSLGAIIGQYKSVCTKQIRRYGRSEFEWQSRFYDKIIRTRRAFRAVRRYIRAHPDE
jgi:REP element-mobilizing transposase RayT